MELFALHIFILLNVYRLVLVIENPVHGFTCVKSAEDFARVNGTARLNFSVKGQIEGVATFEFKGPSGVLGQLTYNSKSNYLSITNARDVRIDADWDGNVQITKSHVTSSDLGLYSLAKVGREFRECSFLFILDPPTQPNIIPEYTIVGENATLICNSSSTTYPSNHSLGLTYSWRVNDVTITTRQFVTFSGNRLIITNLTERDARLKHTCMATENVTNGYTSDISDQFSFNITYGPDENTTIISPPGSLYTLDEGTVLEDINCTGICFPVCFYQWVKAEYSTTTVVANDSGVLSLGVLDRDEAARYICTVSNPDNKRNVTTEIIVNVKYGPDLNTTILSPSGTSYTLQEDTVITNISCYGDCYPKCEYSWTRVRVNRTIGNDHVMSLGHLNRNNTDTYVCTVTNPDNNRTVSRDINISVTYGPDYNTTSLSPSALTYIVNEDILLNDINCSGDCFPDCEYRWMKFEANGVAMIENQTGVLSLGVINRTAAATYTCTVSNPDLNYTVTLEVTIYVRYGPDEDATSLSPPTNSYTVDEHSFINPISCISRCYLDCLYKWTKIVSGEKETVSDGAVLSLDIVERSDAAIYVCTVSNLDINYGIVTRGITVHLRYGPDLPITNVQSPFTITEGEESGDIICSSKCYPACFNTWTNVTSGIDIAHTGTFTFGTINRYQAGDYECTSRNIDTKNTSESIIQVIVNYAPDVSIRMSTTNFTEGANITLFCEAVGVPSNYSYMAFTQTWNGMEIHNTHTALLGTTTHSSIHIPSLQLRDSGTYICTVNNGIVGRNGVLDQNASASIHVKVLPKVLKGDLTYFGAIDGPASAIVPVYSDPEIDSVRFIRNGNFVLPFDTKYKISYHKLPLNVMFYDMRVKIVGDEIQITVNNLTEDDFANYTLVLRNSLGQTEVTVVLLPESEPYSPTIFILQWRKITPILLWARNHNGGHEQSFVIQTTKDGETDWLNYRIIDENDDFFKINESFFMANITDLNQGSYRLRIIARNIIGDSEPVYLNSSLAVDAIKRENGSKDNESISTGTIIGTSSGIFLVITVVSVVVVVIYKRRNKPKTECMERCAPYNTLESPKENDYEEPASYASVTVYACAAKPTTYTNAVYENIELKPVASIQN